MLLPYIWEWPGHSSFPWIRLSLVSTSLAPPVGAVQAKGLAVRRYLGLTSLRRGCSQKKRKIRRISHDRSAKKVAQPDVPVASQNKDDNLLLEREATDGMTANIRGFLLNVKGITPIRVVRPKSSTSFFVIQECQGHGRFNVILAVLPQWRRYRSSSWSSLPRRHAWPRHRQSRVHQLARAG
jgi:hypothetical protein